MAESWIAVSVRLFTNPKFIALQARLKISEDEAAALLLRLWSWAFDYADDGDLTRFADHQIADACHWSKLRPGDPEGGELLAALAAHPRGGHGFLDPHGEGYTIHDWDAFGGRLPATRRAWREAKLKEAPKEVQGKVSRNSDGTSQRTSQGTSATRGEETRGDRGDKRRDVSHEDQSVSMRAPAREASGGANDNGSPPPAADLRENRDPFAVVRARCLAVAGPATAADIEDLVQVEIMRLSGAASRAADPAAYQAECLRTYEPPEGLIAALRIRKEKARRAAFPAREAPDHEGTPRKMEVGRAMPDPPAAF